MRKITVNIGTKNPTKFSVDLDEFGDRISDTKLDVGGVKDDMIAVLEHDMNLGDQWISDGTRNDFAVNDCIALWVLGYNPEKWFEAFLDAHGQLFWISDIEAFLDHVHRVSEYLGKWGPLGSRNRAIDFMIE